MHEKEILEIELNSIYIFMNLDQYVLFYRNQVILIIKMLRMHSIN